MPDALIALVTCGSVEEARAISEALVEEHLAACVNVVSTVESCYRWQGKLNWDREHLLVIKTTAPNIDRVRQRVLELHSYEVPEFIAVKVVSGSEPYLKWMIDSVR